MSNRKLNYNRPVPSSESVKKHQNFDDILSQATVAPTPFFKSIGFWGAIGSSVIALTLLTYQFINSTKKKNAYEAKSTLAINSNELPEDTECLTPMHEENDIKFESFQLDPSEDQTIYVEGGAIIEIPANSFILNNEKNIKVEARVFRSKSDAFLAGVPMDYGDQSAFESAGMIEIRGYQGEEELTLAKDAAINVVLGLHKSPTDFNFYSLDEETSNWNEYEATFKGDPVQTDLDVTALTNEISITDEQIVNIQNELDVLSKPEKADFHLAENANKVFELKFNKQEFPELKSFERLQFEAKCSNIKYRKILEKTWSGVELIQITKGKYEAQFSNQRGDKTNVSVVPVLTGEAAELAYKSYLKAVEAIEKEEREKKERVEELALLNAKRRLKIQEIIEEAESNDETSLFEERAKSITAEMKAKKKMLNQFYEATAEFSTNRWGVFNCDKPVKYPKAPLTPHSFALNDHLVSPNSVYVFDLKKDVRYTFGNSTHPIRDVALQDHESVVVVRDKNGNMAYARISEGDKIDQRPINLTPIDMKSADLEFFKSLLDEKERVRA